VLIELVNPGNEKTLDISKRLLHYSDVDRDKLCF